MTEHAIPTCVTALAVRFTHEGALAGNLTEYHSLYWEFLDIAKAASNKVGMKKFGNMRSGDLTTKGQTLHFYKQMLNCKRRHAI